jgi:hypothetical protein
VCSKFVRCNFKIYHYLHFVLVSLYKVFHTYSVGILISGFRHNVDICAGLVYYVASCDNSLPTFRDHTTPRNIPEERRYHNFAGCL